MLIRDFRIRGFRAFEHLDIAGLGRANLILGRNSVGKTSILEALWLYATDGALPVLSDILAGRDELRSNLRGTEVSAEAGLQHLFYGRGGIREPGRRIEFSSDIVAEPLRIEPIWFVERDGEEADLESSPWIRVDREEPSARPGLEVSAPGRRPLVRPLSSIRRSPRPAQASLELGNRAQLVPANGMTGVRMAQLWDLISLTTAEESVTEVLRIVVPELERIAFVGDTSSDRRAVAKLKGVPRPVPIRHLGDGATRLLGISLALVSVAGGILLLDEIENGIYYASQVRLWEFIFEAATRLDVQVVATTHSLDCIRAFGAAAAASVELGVALRIDRDSEGVRTVLFDENDLRIAVEQSIEVR